MLDIRTFYSNIGVIESISDGMINILGLQNATNGEMVEIFINSNIEYYIHIINIIKYRDDNDKNI